MGRGRRPTAISSVVLGQLSVGLAARAVLREPSEVVPRGALGDGRLRDTAQNATLTRRKVRTHMPDDEREDSISVLVFISQVLLHAALWGFFAIMGGCLAVWFFPTIDFIGAARPPMPPVEVPCEDHAEAAVLEEREGAEEVGARRAETQGATWAETQEAGTEELEDEGANQVEAEPSEAAGWMQHGEAVFAALERVGKEQLANECFRHDWPLIPVQAIVSEKKLDASELEVRVDALKETVCRHYEWIVALYRRLSSQDSQIVNFQLGLSVFGVSFRTAISLLDNRSSKLLDPHKNLTKTEAELLYKKVLHLPAAHKAKLVVHAEKSLVRHQFTEWLLRIAQAKFQQDSLHVAVEKTFKALSKLCLECDGDYVGLFDSGSNDAVSKVFLRYSDTLKEVFLLHCQRVNNRRVMVLDGWRRLLDQSNVFVTFPGFKRDFTGYAFRLGMNTQADEQFSAAFQLMSFSEFQRAIGAVIFLSEYRSQGACTPERFVVLLDTYFSRDLILLARRTSSKMSSKLRMEQGGGTPKIASEDKSCSSRTNEITG
mmetsp:Transcript_86086/g.200163  ORF Transcript_86086/g.200163 Transcript_86086/m.200163 type:complete len:544 (+) Transcript_86086:121-1752(+)